MHGKAGDYFDERSDTLPAFTNLKWTSDLQTMKHLIQLFLFVLLLVECTPADVEWPAYLGDKASSQYKDLKQINLTNVSSLEVAWTYNTGGKSPENRSQIQCNPIIVDGVLYGTTPVLKVFALDAKTGEELWSFDPSFENNSGLNSNRGVTYWESGSDKRILFTAGSNIFALDASSGMLKTGFGSEGVASLKQGLGERSEDLFVASTTPGVVFEDLYILGTRVSENANAAPGYIRAFDVLTGELQWTFHTIPRPGEFGYDTWPADAWERIGGANSWSGMTLDEENEMLFVPTGSASFDFWGGDRVGDNLFANCLLALNVRTGERIWHFQTVHHDIWDRDLPSPPNLVTIEKEERSIQAVSQATKSGYIYIFERLTGEPIFPIDERPVPPSDLDGEVAARTQPFPSAPPPFSRQAFLEEDVNMFFDEYTDSLKQLVKNTRGGGQYVPPSTQGTMYFPGFDGGAEWGGQAYDPESGILYVNANEMPWIQTMVRTGKEEVKSGLLADIGSSIYTSNCMACHGPDLQGNEAGNFPPLLGLEDRRTRDEIMEVMTNGRGFMPGFSHLTEDEMEAIIAFVLNEETVVTDAHEFDMDQNEDRVPYTHTGYNRFLLPNGYPAVKPPWGTLSAIDLSAGEILWQVPLGEFEELTKMGIPKTGTENYGGPVVTSGGLVFIGASKDEHIRAFDKNTGEEIWKYKLPAGGYATPSTYMLDGKQFLVIACGGGKMNTPSGETYVAFSLPD